MPDLFFDYAECLIDQQRYCEDFALEISAGNAELEFLFVYLEADLSPHQVFRIERQHPSGEEIEVPVDFTMTGMDSCEVFNVTDANGDEVALEIHSTFWLDDAAAIRTAAMQSVDP